MPENWYYSGLKVVLSPPQSDRDNANRKPQG